ncbi:hypothetical protein TVAG_409140 [Trichomonas vaginalis G3]|uniref:Uncharacterized protein n=1 Tax=Trichomonas vaginalis (strain ATCC PRA-98 / G3) TaxID=412133 RepID=A2G2Q4_TRIV3|nr:epidermal cell fate specification [Trichomonas vaginalis G3]EAX88562.1 hypothetical protein TVAG_409140 [Trichomonas vaginalis G3]KAI5482801.1 epidermal cell fate specification [Trichomonas vaginalis G3]|eukprot:XP_001301492.1 hypothetical protein [Trichomonas vaginalis G3]
MCASLDKSISVPFAPFGLSFNAPFATETRLAISSFETGPENVINTCRLVGASIDQECIMRMRFPQTKVMFNPQESKNLTTNLISSGDGIHLFSLNQDTLMETNHIEINTSSDPVTCFDWSAYNEQLVIAGSTDGTATPINIETGAPINKFIAHDHPVHDICFCGGPSTFVTAGFDGSLRLLDLRDPTSSYIYFQTAMPLMRVSVYPIEPNKISLFARESKSATVVDTRRPCIPYAFTSPHGGQVTGVIWSRIGQIIYTSSADGHVFETNLETANALDIYDAEAPIESISLGQGILAVGCQGKVDILSLSYNQ